MSDKSVPVPDRACYFRMQSAWKVTFNWENICSTQERNLMASYSNAIGCPEEFFYFPLLSCGASCMGLHCKLKINCTWYEPSVLWTVIASRKGEKKSAAAGVVLEGIQKLERKLQQAQTNADESKHEHPRLYVNIFSFERLHQLMAKNESQMLGFFDEFSLLYELIANNKGGKSQLDRKVFLTLYNGGEWVRDYINQTNQPSMRNTCLNLTGFIQPKYVIKQLALEDIDGFNDRFIFICPPEKDSLWEELKPLEDDVTTFEEVFTVLRRGHSETNDEIFYQFEESAGDEVQKYYNQLVKRKAEIHWDENRRGILSKARGQFLRICMIKQGIQNALIAIEEMKQDSRDPVNEDDDDLEWRTLNISTDTVKRSAALMDYLIEVRFALMPPEVKYGNEGESSVFEAPQTNVDVVIQSSGQEQTEMSQEQLWECYDRQLPNFPNECKHNIKSFLTNGDEIVTFTKVMQRHLMPPLNTPGKANKYASSAAKYFIKKLEKTGFGTVEMSGRKALGFHKRPWEDLGEDAVDIVNVCGITSAAYKKKKN